MSLLDLECLDERGELLRIEPRGKNKLGFALGHAMVKTRTIRLAR